MSSTSTEDTEEFPGRLMHQTALWDNVEFLEDLLHGELSYIDCQDSWGRTPLHAAAITDSSRCLHILLQAGANPNIKTGPRADGRTCLHVAAEHGAIENVKTLLAFGADLLAQDSDGMTALDIAEKADHHLCMEALKQAADAKELARRELHSSLRDLCFRGDVSKAKALLRSSGTDAEIINSAPNGSNTLLFKACEEGHRDMVRLLLEHKADGRIHPVTKYSPLYIACHYGRRDIVDMLLKKFPYLVNVCTVERWLPIHACIINGHTAVLEQILKFPYPNEIQLKFKDKTGKWEYEMPFDINMKDVTGKSALYLACYAGNQKLVDLLLKHRVYAKRFKSKDELLKEREAASSPLAREAMTVSSPSPAEESPSRHRIAGSIQTLMSKLNLVRGVDPSEHQISPINIDMYCNSETALHVAVKNRHHTITSMVLSSGANPNLRMYLPDDDSDRLSNDNYIFTGSTALVEACRNHDLGMLDLLLKNHARDEECKALYVAVQAKDKLIISKLLALKAHPDPEYKINKRAFDMKPNQQFSCLPNSPSVGVYSSLLPTVPVMINWHGQRCLSYLKDQWFVDASVALNQKLKLSPKNQIISLYAITRLDISNNALSQLPDVIFQLPSLRILIASQNKIESLPSTVCQVLCDGTATLPRKKSGANPNSPVLPLSVLEEIHLKDNRLTSLPEGLFMLPALQHLDVSNNKLLCLPYRMWFSPKLRELNASFNLLNSLPLKDDECFSDSTSGIDSACSEISDEESVSSACDHSSCIADEITEDCSNLRKCAESRCVLTLSKHGNVVTCCRTRDLNHHSLWSRAIHVQESLTGTNDLEAGVSSRLQILNLSHNSFSSIPLGLPCLVPALSRLNLSYNRLKEMGCVSCYPVALKQLDLSHNDIDCWPGPGLAHSESLDNIEGANFNKLCFALNESANRHQKSSNPARRSVLIPFGRSRGPSSPLNSSGSCPHRRHLRLEALRTLILADNELSRLSLHIDDGGDFTIISDIDSNESPVRSASTPKHRLLFPNISMLDVSNNHLQELPLNLHELTNLSVLNIAGNVDITELPPEMGLLSRLWNLNTRGCSLQEPLKGMIDSKKYKTMDVIGYLKSILEDAKPYARMKMMIVGVQGIGKTSLLEQLRHEGTGSYRKKPVEHWAKRMGNKNINTRTSRGTTMSTVGVDIADWIYEKKIRGHSSYGPVTFRTWDFGGQREYYATHQYFLSRRSLYLVVWNICDGEKGVEEILQWLVNIQARAPNSPVIIVGSHYDLVKEKFPPSWSEDLQRLIREKFINVIDADKLGLPRVLDTIEVSCKTRHNIKLLCNLIYDTVFSLKTPGSKERLLEQKIPASYLALEDIVGIIAAERRIHGRDPVLPADRYQSLVTQEMANKGFKPFRDTSELNQATTFLHENGVLLHYEDVTLKDLYFLDPQWLCDMLAHVVTIREINPFVRSGVMKLDDLKHVFKSSTCAPLDAKSYIVSLLNKFEVALTWDNRTLLIPCLLPSEEQLSCGMRTTDVKIPVRTRGWVIRSKKFSTSSGISLVGNSAFMKGSEDKRASRPSSMQGLTLESISTPKKETGDNAGLGSPSASKSLFQVNHRSAPHSAIRRLLLMSYFPSGFWSRLLTRVLADDSVVDIIKNYFVVPPEVVSDQDLTALLGGKAEWSCWQTGMELHYAHTTLFRLKEVLPGHSHSRILRKSAQSPRGGSSHEKCGPSATSCYFDYKNMKFLIKIEGSWTDVEVGNCAVLEIVIPNEAVVIKRSISEFEDKSESEVLAKGIQSVVLDPSPECIAKLLSLTVDHIDTLLEDWYPTLGTRFVHTSEGKFLVTRLVPCPACLECHGNHEGPGNHPNAKFLPDNWGSFVEMNPLYCSMTGSVLHQTLQASFSSQKSQLTAPCLPQQASSTNADDTPRSASIDVGAAPLHQLDRANNNSPSASNSPPVYRAGRLSPRHSWESRGSYTSDGDSGVGPDSTSSSRKPSAEGRPDLRTDEPGSDAAPEMTPVVYSFMVEECILAAYAGHSVACPLHGHLLMAQISPDIVFLDLGERLLVRPESIKQGKLIGRGGFGFVFAGTCRNQADDEPLDVALKMLQPVDPGLNARASAITAFKAAQSKWERDPLQYACKAYCSARQEVNILLSLCHPNIVPLVGVCPRPLALVLEYAPKGSLDQCLKHYRRSGAHLSLLTLQVIILQVAKALEYLHGQRIIYRDLKSENVLVWDLPLPFHLDSHPRVDVRLADYGISRLTLPSGAKGFGGTEGFMAPEMMRHNGEEEYTEKVDCFSFGMFMYELLTTHQPYEHYDNVKEHVLEGGRPALTNRETEYPVYILDLMVLCWSQIPRYRPTASQVVSIASAPEFTHLLDVISLENCSNVTSGVRIKLEIPSTEEDEDGPSAQDSLWVVHNSSQVDIMTTEMWGWTGHTSIEGLPEVISTMCLVGPLVWLGDTSAGVHGYRAENHKWVFSYCLDPDSRTSSVKSICDLHDLGRVAVALSNGRLFLCRSDATPASPVMGEGSFILSELAGFTREIFCLASVPIGDTWSLWCGGSEGIVSVFTIRKDGHVMNQESASHILTPDCSSEDAPLADVTLVYSLGSSTTSFSPPSLKTSIWTYVHPGCAVYQWDASSKMILNKLDCSKLVPCSESLQSISIEEHLSPSHCQITAVAVCGEEIFVGTAWGCIVIAEASSMRPITVFRPFEADVGAIIPLFPMNDKVSEGSQSCSSDRDAPMESAAWSGAGEGATPLVATMGRGYRSLLSRYAPMPKSGSSDPRSVYCLLWRSHEWLNS